MSAGRFTPPDKATPFLPKPFELDQLVTLIARALSSAAA